MHVVAVPNWSFGRNKDLLRKFRDILESWDVAIHYCQSDVDHNRTVTGFSGEWAQVRGTLLALAEAAFPAIDLNRHVGVHPRIGALDVCPFLGNFEEVNPQVVGLASELSDLYDIPVFLYEKSERGRHESDLPALRKGGFGSLLTKDLKPDFGPTKAHPLLGATVMGMRDPLIALNVNFHGADLDAAKAIAKWIRTGRADGDVRFLGVRALGLPLVSQERVQVSMNMTLPDLTPVDPILEEVKERGEKLGLSFAENELIGVIRASDLEHATLLPYRPEQVLE